jgi:cytidylate kinase
MNKPVIGSGGLKEQARIGAHVRAWEAIQKAQPHHVHERLPFITISREFGCEAVPLAQHLAELLNERCRPTIPWVAYDQQLLDAVAKELHLAKPVIESLDERRRDEMSELFNAILNLKVDEGLVVRKTAEVIRSLASHGNAILVGRGGYLITQDLRTGLHIRLVAPRSWRVQKFAQKHNVPFHEAEHILNVGERERERFLRTFFVQSGDPDSYHDLILDNSRFNLLQEAEIVFAALSCRYGEVLTD